MGTSKTGRASSRLAVEAVVVLFVIAMMFPLYNLVNISFKTPSELLTDPISLTSTLHWNNYSEAFSGMRFLRSVYNSFLITGITVFIGVFLYTMAGYATSRARELRWFFGGALTVLVAGLTLPPQAVVTTIVPWLKQFGLVNTYAGIICVYLGAFAPFGVFLVSSFMNTVPIELEESAYIDGAGPFAIYRHITLPLLNPAIVMLVTLNAVDIWNNLLFPLIILQGPDKRTIPLALVFARGEYSTPWNEFFAGMVLSLIPIVIIFILAQRKMIENLTSGALKF